MRFEKQLAVLASVLLVVLCIDLGKALTNCASGLVSCEDTLSLGSNSARILN